ncbi:MAG: hypothetical protein PVJ57_18460 [Phycisphaerae bacterium]
MNKLLGVGLALVLAAAAVGAETGPYQRWAIIGSPELARTGWVDLLTVALAAQPDIQLVERSAVAEATRELALATVLEADGAGQRLKLGRLLGADALLLLSRELRDDERLLRIVVSDARIGARIWTECLTYEPGVPEPVVATLSERVAELRNRYPEGLSRIVGVPAFVSRNLVHDYDRLQDDLANVLAAGIGAFAGTAVIETEEAEAIAHELAISGTELAEHVVPLFIRGDYRVEEMGDERGALTLWLQVSGGSEPERTVERRYDSVASGVEALQRELSTELLGAATAGPGLSIDEQVSLLTRQADSFARLGDLRRAVALHEAALLLKPDSVKLAQEIIDEYIKLVPHEQPPRWHLIPPETAIQDWYRRIGRWRRSVELLEQLIRQGAISQEVTLRLYEQLDDGLSRFFRTVPDTRNGRSPFPRYPAEVLAPLEPLGEECTRLHRRFVQEVLPLVRQLPLDGTKTASQTETTWAKACVSIPEYHPYDVPSCYSRAKLERIREFVIRFGPELSTPEVLDTPLRITSDPDVAREFSVAELRAFWESLAAEADNPQVQSRVEEGLLLLGATYDAEGLPRDTPAVLAELDAWLDRNPEETASRSTQQLRSRIAMHRSKLKPKLQEHRWTRRRDSYPLTRPPALMRFQPVRMMIAKRDGTWEPLASPSLAGYTGWCERYGWVCGFIPAGDFDIVWALRGIFVQRRPGVLEEVHVRDDEHVYRAVAFDGVNIWAISCHLGIEVFALDGTLVAKLSTEEGMPPADRSACLEPLGPGEVLATGALDKPVRSWIARLWLDNGQVGADVFHEATEPGQEEVNGESADERDPKKWSPQTAFRPDRIYRVPYPLSPGRVDLIVSRGSRRRFHLRVLFEERRVEIVPGFISSQESYGGSFHFLEDGSVVWARGALLRLQKHLSLDSLGQSVRVLYDAEDRSFDGRVIEDHGLLYVPGRPWIRYEQESGLIQELYPAEQRVLQAYGRSALLGVLAWSEAGRVYRLCTDEAASTQPPPIVPTLPAAIAPPAPPEVMNQLITGIYRWRDARGLWPRSLAELRPQYFDGDVPSSIDYAWFPEGANQLTCQRGPQTWTYVFGGCDEGGYFLRDQQLVPWRGPVPPAPDSTPREILLRAREELVRRVEAEPGEALYRRCLLFYLCEVNELAEARAAALDWIKAMPRSTAARYALLAVEHIIRFGPDDRPRGEAPGPRYVAETVVDWAVLNGGTFAYSMVQSEYGQLGGRPLVRDNSEWCMVEPVLFDACSYLLRGRQSTAVIELCDAWERQAKQSPDTTDASYVYFRAAALLQRGNVERAREVAQELPELVATDRTWVKCVPDLLHALAAEDASYPPFSQSGYVDDDWWFRPDGDIYPDTILLCDPGSGEDTDDDTDRHGVVLGPDGQPLPDASVLLMTAQAPPPAEEPVESPTTASTQPGRAKPPRTASRITLTAPEPTAAVLTDALGRFRLPDTQPPFVLAAIHPAGYVETVVEEDAPQLTLVLQPWGRIEGHCLLGQGEPCHLRLEAAAWPEPPVAGLVQHAWAFNAVFTQSSDEPIFGEQRARMRELRTSSGVDGIFAFEQIPPGEWQLTPMWLGNFPAMNRRMNITVEPGQVSRIELLPTGRRVTGRLVSPTGADLDLRKLSLSLALTPATMINGADIIPHAGPRLHERDAFCFYDVAPGGYWLQVWSKRRVFGQPRAYKTWTVQVPDTDDIPHAPPVDLGDLPITEELVRCSRPETPDSRRSRRNTPPPGQPASKPSPETPPGGRS